MTIQKAHWNTEGDNVRLSMPFSKVDKERRIVSGFATLDNVDRQNDIVTPEASLSAFKKFKGNIREMHQPVAVGKMVSFKEDKYFDPETKKMYNGVYVSAYISKGAQDTWEKVLDGTLSGFSIGGKMNKWDTAFNEDVSKKVRVIKEYDLMELSLVDTPANQFANILSIEKVDGVDTFKGDAMDTVIENVFWDPESGLVLLSENETETSPASGLPMQNIGFVEKDDNEKTEMLKFLVDSAKGINVTKMNKENDNMADEIVNDVVAEVAPEAEVVVDAPATEEVVETVVAEEAPEAPAVDAEPALVEEVVEEVPSSEEAIAKSVAELTSTVTTAFSDITAIVKTLADANASLTNDIAELKKSLGLVATAVTETETNLGKRIDAVEADTAFRKSGDLSEVLQHQPEQVEKSLWGGSFLKTSDLFR